jgi:lysophospholipid acyltransferase (LPLAT)-like uncharacterized protein
VRRPTDPAVAPRPRKRRLRRRIKKALARIGVWLVCRILPPIYVAYMWFVHATSKVEHLDTDLLWLLRERYGGLVGVMWHQEVFTVAYAFRQYEGHTLASRSDFGSLITAMLALNGFVVFRGGSSTSKHRRTKVLPELIRHMRDVPGVAYGITCDGSNGPIYELKQGSVLIAQACHKPMIVCRTWARRRIDLGGWDRPYIPLPFNHIVQAFAGPYFVPVDAGATGVEAFRLELQNDLLELTHWVHEYLGERAPAAGRPDFPPGWAPRWSPQALPRYPVDPPPGHPAAAQTRAEPRGGAARRRQVAAVARSRGAWPARSPAHRDPGHAIS